MAEIGRRQLPAFAGLAVDDDCTAANISIRNRQHGRREYSDRANSGCAQPWRADQHSRMRRQRLPSGRQALSCYL